MIDKPRILGTGLSGLVGTRIVELLGDSFDFENYDLTTGVDITDKEDIRQRISQSKAEVLIHLAAFTDVNAAWSQQGDKNGLCYRVNVLGTKNIAELCQEYKKYLIYFSTDFVFDGVKPPRGGYTEEDKPGPIEWYGQTKYLAEEEVKKSGCRFSILRIAFPFRAEFEEKSDLVRKIITGLENNSLYPFFSDQIITPSFIDDIACGVGVFLTKQSEGIYHLTGSSSLSPYQLAKKIADTFNFDNNLIKKGNLEEYLHQNPNTRPYQKNLSLSGRKAEKELGIKMKTIDEALLVLRSQIGA